MARMSKAALAAQAAAEANARLIEEELAALTDEQRDLLAKREVEVVVAYKCEDCDEIMEEDELDTLYECGECGGKAVGVEEGKRCDDCNKFRGRVDDKNEATGCTRCGEGQVSEVVAADPDGSGDLMELEDAIEALESGDYDEDEDDTADKPERKRRADLSPDPVPVTEDVPVSALKMGDWYIQSVRTAGGTDRVISKPVEVHDEPVSHESGIRIGSTYFNDANGTVPRVVRWERPPAAYDIAAKDLTLLHVTCDPQDWSVQGRMAFTEIRTDLATGQVTAINKYRRSMDPQVFAADAPLTVIDRDQNQLFGRMAFEVWWEVPCDRYQRTEHDSLAYEEDPRGLEFLQQLQAAGLPTDTFGRKHYMSLTGGHRQTNAGKPYALIVERKPRQILKLLEVLQAMNLQPTTIVQTTQSR